MHIYIIYIYADVILSTSIRIYQIMMLAQIALKLLCHSVSMTNKRSSRREAVGKQESSHIIRTLTSSQRENVATCPRPKDSPMACQGFSCHALHPFLAWLGRFSMALQSVLEWFGSDFLYLPEPPPQKKQEDACLQPSLSFEVIRVLKDLLDFIAHLVGHGRRAARSNVDGRTFNDFAILPWFTPRKTACRRMFFGQPSARTISDSQRFRMDPGAPQRNSHAHTYSSILRNSSPPCWAVAV